MRSPWLGQASLFWSPLSTEIFVVTVVSSIKNLTDHDLLWAMCTQHRGYPCPCTTLSGPKSRLGRRGRSLGYGRFQGLSYKLPKGTLPSPSTIRTEKSQRSQDSASLPRRAVASSSICLLPFLVQTQDSVRTEGKSTPAFGSPGQDASLKQGVQALPLLHLLPPNLQTVGGVA